MTLFQLLIRSFACLALMVEKQLLVEEGQCIGEVGTRKKGGVKKIENSLKITIITIREHVWSADWEIERD